MDESERERDEKTESLTRFHLVCYLTLGEGEVGRKGKRKGRTSTLRGTRDLKNVLFLR